MIPPLSCFSTLLLGQIHKQMKGKVQVKSSSHLGKSILFDQSLCDHFPLPVLVLGFTSRWTRALRMGAEVL